MGSYKCKICLSDLNLNECKQFSSRCPFTNRNILRYECNHCNVIFGLISMIDCSVEELRNQYVEAAKNHKEGYTTPYEIETFHTLNPTKDGIYLNYGSGELSETNRRLRAEGYQIYSYEPFVYNGNDDFVIKNKDELLKFKFDGIFAHNVLEHFQDPVGEFELAGKILTDNGKLAHSTECYQYKYEFSSFHLFYLLGDSLQIVLERSGFKIVEESRKNYRYIFMKDV